MGAAIAELMAATAVGRSARRAQVAWKSQRYLRHRPRIGELEVLARRVGVLAPAVRFLRIGPPLGAAIRSGAVEVVGTAGDRDVGDIAPLAGHTRPRTRRAA